MQANAGSTRRTMERSSSLWRREASLRSTDTNEGCEDDDNDYVEVGEDENGVKDGDDDDGGKLEIHGHQRRL